MMGEGSTDAAGMVGFEPVSWFFNLMDSKSGN